MLHSPEILQVSVRERAGREGAGREVRDGEGKREGGRHGGQSEGERRERGMRDYMPCMKISLAQQSTALTSSASGEKKALRVIAVSRSVAQPPNSAVKLIMKSTERSNSSQPSRQIHHAIN